MFRAIFATSAREAQPCRKHRVRLTRHARETKHVNYLGLRESKLCIILLSVVFATYSVRLIGTNRRNIVIQTIFKIVYKSRIETPACGKAGVA